MGMATVAPEHICLAICNSRNTCAIRVLRSCASLPTAPCRHCHVRNSNAGQLPPIILPVCRIGINIEIVKRESRRRIQVEREADAKKSVTKASSPAACTWRPAAVLTTYSGNW